MADRLGFARWFDWRRTRKPQLPDAADMGTEIGLELALPASHRSDGARASAAARGSLPAPSGPLRHRPRR